MIFEGLRVLILFLCVFGLDLCQLCLTQQTCDGTEISMMVEIQETCVQYVVSYRSVLFCKGKLKMIVLLC
jgi:hypothetical protein